MADVGSGTGFMAERFVEFGCDVTGVEPNADMRQAGDPLSEQPRQLSERRCDCGKHWFARASFDLVTAGQAFHWFEPIRTRKEFRRIMRAPGWIVLVWNSRPATLSPVTSEYEAILEELHHDYQKVAEKNSRPETMNGFLGNGASLAHARFPNPPVL